MKQKGKERDTFLENLTHTLGGPDSNATSFPVDKLCESCPALKLRTVGEYRALNRPIQSSWPKRAGLALNGLLESDDGVCVQLLAQAEQRLLVAQANVESPAYVSLLQAGPPCFILTDLDGDVQAFAPFLAHANAHGVPVLATHVKSAQVASCVSLALAQGRAPSIAVHGGLVVYGGLGLLLVGKSGSGKSDSILDLVMAGHALVADDVVRLHRDPLGRVVGNPDAVIARHMDVRGVGILNMETLVGPAAVLDAHSVDLVIYLQEYAANSWQQFDKLDKVSVLGVDLPLLHLPSQGGRNQVSLITMALRSYIHKSRAGRDGQDNLSDRLDGLLAQPE